MQERLHPLLTELLFSMHAAPLPDGTELLAECAWCSEEGSCVHAGMC